MKCIKPSLRTNSIQTLVVLLVSLLFHQGYAQDVTIATFNAEFLNKKKVHMKFGLPFDIEKASKKDRKYWDDDQNRSRKLVEASDSVASFIKAMNADIVTLTEVGGRDDIAVLDQSLRNLGIVYDHIEVCECRDPFTGQHVAVLSKFPLKEVWPSIEGRALYLLEPDGDAEKETGISKGLKVTVELGGQDVDVFVAHLKSERGGFDSDAQRLAQANVIRRAVIGQLVKGRKVIVTGDLNSQKGTESIYRIRGFDDVYEELIQTGHSDYFEDYGVRWTYNYKGEPEQIDHILISPGLTTRKGIETRIMETKSDFISNHNPVIVKLSF